MLNAAIKQNRSSSSANWDDELPAPFPVGPIIMGWKGHDTVIDTQTPAFPVGPIVMGWNGYDAVIDTQTRAGMPALAIIEYPHRSAATFKGNDPFGAPSLVNVSVPGIYRIVVGAEISSSNSVFSTARLAPYSLAIGRPERAHAAAPTGAESQASKWLPKFALPDGWTSPHITRSEVGEVVCEWWHAEKKLTVYFGETGIEYIKVWGTDIVAEMESGQLDTELELPALRSWLYS